MATQHEMAERWVSGAMRQIRETGQTQQSADWGYGERKRCVTVIAFDARSHVYEAAALCWGFPERTFIGTFNVVYWDLVEALAGAG